MNTWNKVTAIGMLGKDPEVRYAASGTAVASFSIATEHSFKRNDQWEKETEWVNCTAFGRTAERIGEYLRKGSGVYIEGRLQTSKWEDKDGVTRYSTKVIVNKCDFLTNFGRNESGGSQEQDRGGYDGGSSGGNTSSDDDIPF